MRSKTGVRVTRCSLILPGSLCLTLLLSWALCGCSRPAANPTGGKDRAAPARKGEGGRRGGGETAPVTVATALSKDVPVETQAVGNVEAFLTVTVKAQVSGELTGVFFREGDFVRKGELLFKIDPRQLEAQLNQAQANLTRDEAQLGQAQATLAKDSAEEEYSRAQAARYSRLLEHRLISKEQAEQVRASSEAASQAVREDQASINSARAAVSASRAAVENIKVQLGYTSIRAPIDGRTGYLSVQQGNIVNANSTDLVTINQIRPIYVVFSVPQARLADIKLKQLVTAAAPGASSAPEEGALALIDNKVDAKTGTIRLRAIFPNLKSSLWPGEFVRVTLRLGIQPGVVVVPSQAVQTSQDGTYVFVVKSDRTVEFRPVVPGTRYGEEIVVEKNLRAGEVVVTEGQLRLAPGMGVQIMSADGQPLQGRHSRGLEP